MITKKTIDEIFETVRVEDVIGDFVDLKKRGINLLGLCPFHHEKTPSFTVSPAKSIYKCFGCGKGGNAVNFIMEHEGLTYPETLRYLAKKYGIAIEETVQSDEEKEEQQVRESLYLINDFAVQYYQQQLFETEVGRTVALSYFKERGFREATIQKFGLGYAPNNRNALTLTAVNKGYKAELLQRAGLTSKKGYDFFFNRVQFPIHNLSGKVIGFGGRILDSNIKAPKYINTPDSEIYNKSKVLYGIYFARQAIRRADNCWLVEGYTDVISLHQAGIEQVVASSGTSLTVDQIRLIKRYTDNITILYDGDPAGIKAALRGLDLVLEQDMNVRIVLLPDGQDPDSYLQQVGQTAFGEYVDAHADDFIFFKANLLLAEAKGDPVKKTAVIKDIIQSIAKIKDPIKRSLYIRESAQLLEINEAHLTDEANRLLRKALNKKLQTEQAPPPTTEEAVAPTIPQTKQDRATLNDEFQEKDIVRLLITFGDAIIEEEATVGMFILANMEDVLDEFDSVEYGRIVRMCYQRIEAGLPLDQQYFLRHEETAINQLAITLLSTNHEYSFNWEEKLQNPLQTQPMPEKNFWLDARLAVNRFKLKKVERMLERLYKKQDRRDISLDEAMQDLKVAARLKVVQKELAELLGTVTTTKQNPDRM